jgi:hypothetical protein
VLSQARVRRLTANMGAIADLGRRPRHLGRHRRWDSRGACGYFVVAAPTPPLPRRRRTGAARCPGDPACRQLLHQELFGGPTNLPASAARLRALRDLPLGAPVEPRIGQRARLAGSPSPMRPGGLFAPCVAGYSGFRIVEELLRVDPPTRSWACVSTSMSRRGCSWPLSCGSPGFSREP